MPEDKAQLLESIKNFVPINELTTNLQMRLLDRVNILEVKKGRFIFKQGDTDNYSYYLLDGDIEFYADNQLSSVINSGSDRARYALAQLQPRQFSAKAKTLIKVLQVERSVLDQMMVLANETTSELGSVTMDMEVDEFDGADEEDGDWMTAMLQSELFSRMPMANIHQLFALLEPVEYKAGDVVINQGEPGEDYFIISEGRCAVYRKPSSKAKDVKLAELKVGDSFGEEALISNSTRNATIKMLTDGMLMRLGKDTFVELIKNPTLHSIKFDEAESLIDQGAKWLDVRFPNEYQDSSIEGSLNVPLNSLRMQTEKLVDATKYILFCDTGGRSSTGAFLLAERGFDVAYLEGGLVNNSEAISVKTVVPEAAPVSEPVSTTTPKPTPAAPKSTPVAEPELAPAKEDDKHFDADVRVEILNAELETTDFRMQKAKQQSHDSIDAEQKKEHEKNLKQLQEERKKIEQQKKKAEAESQQRTKEEEARLKKLKDEADREMKAEKKKLEEIYDKNTREMSKLQKLKEESEAKLQKEREKLEKQAEAARKQMKEATRLKQQQELAAQKQMEEANRLRNEIEESKRQLEEQAAKKRLEEDEREKALQAKARIKIEAERKKLAEQYERNSQEFEQLQKQKAAAEAARAAARQEAAKIIEEYKQTHDKERDAEREKLAAERKKLEEEARQIKETMKQIELAKQEAENIKQTALREAEALKQKQTESTSSESLRQKLEADIAAAQKKAKEADREIEDAIHKAKITESAQQENEADMVRKQQEQQALMSKITEDLEDFEGEHQAEKPSVTQIQMQADMMKRIKEKAAAAKNQAAKKNENLLDEISKQLGKDD